MVERHVDPAAALALATAQGVPAAIAAPLIQAVQDGLWAGWDSRREKA